MIPFNMHLKNIFLHSLIRFLNLEKRQKFDNGEDPLDPESGQHPQGFNPFQHFSHFQNGGPFTFKFHFN